ncbi:hypothetical protein BU23DRAFT_596282 [Bimuria novae-zelandiae CBS 107.79]|uniref:Uncharacterized protein n=1 Tax=Bimuria novae-zelandiae CBS 107.79 TaxID=1447943 RepID=A0A6A5VLB3_9PLEO|nr:hypothetical protein BU23DRAFT_596282 [Bimuria novae-zelandiae CBS 107.79]
MAAKRLTLICPSLNKTVENFILTPSTTLVQFVIDIRAALGTLPQAFPWTFDGHRGKNPKDIKDGQRLLVSIGYFDVMESHEEWEPVMLFWEHAEKGLELSNEDVSRAERYILLDEIRKRERKDGNVFNGIRVTMPSSVVDAELAAIPSYEQRDDEFKALYARKVLLGAIEERRNREGVDKVMKTEDVVGCVIWLLKSVKAGESKKSRAEKRNAHRKESDRAKADKEAAKELKKKGKAPQGKLDVVNKDKRGSDGRGSGGGFRLRRGRSSPISGRSIAPRTPSTPRPAHIASSPPSQLPRFPTSTSTGSFIVTALNMASRLSYGEPEMFMMRTGRVAGMEPMVTEGQLVPWRSGVQLGCCGRGLSNRQSNRSSTVPLLYQDNQYAFTLRTDSAKRLSRTITAHLIGPL